MVDGPQLIIIATDAAITNLLVSSLNTKRPGLLITKRGGGKFYRFYQRVGRDTRKPLLISNYSFTCLSSPVTPLKIGTNSHSHIHFVCLKNMNEINLRLKMK